MENVLKTRSNIYDHFHGSSTGPSHFFKPEKADDYAAYYTSMYLIQDTGEAIWSHMDHGFSKNSMQAYIEFWGVMQAILIQQDAICALHGAVVGRKPDMSKLAAWLKLRDTRNVCAGHPASRSHGVPAPQRTFMGRDFGTYDRVTYELWDAHTMQTSHPAIDLRRMIREYTSEACQVLQDVLDCMKSRWP